MPSQITTHTDPEAFRRSACDRLVRVALAGAILVATPMSVALAQTPAESFSAYTAGSAKTVEHGGWDRLLKTYVVPGKDGVNRVAYGRFKAEGQSALKSYVTSLETVDVKSLDRPEQFAFWANLYNAKTIDIVLDKYPVTSIKDISLGGGLVAAVTGGPWKAKVLKAGGVSLSLDDIEHGILRPVFKDPRVHYAVNCASYGCPNLGTAALTGASLEAALDAAAKAYINHPRGIRVDDGAVTASSIYSWFQDDFGGSDEGVLAHVRKYATVELLKKLEGVSEIADTAYNWSLNDAKE